MEIAQSLFRIFHNKGEELYLVGGYVRDLLLGRATEDYDFATSALAIALRANNLRPSHCVDAVR